MGAGGQPGQGGSQRGQCGEIEHSDPGQVGLTHVEQVVERVQDGVVWAMIAAEEELRDASGE
ncbi:MAG: hypothetical protein H0W03_09760 [Solirubrobacterales bacterium]|nr:hypothetical protein [Solirubrobacterales bacterium]